MGDSFLLCRFPPAGDSFQRRGPLNGSFLFSLCGASEASRFGPWLPGLPGPDPGDFLYAQKVTKKAPGDPDPFCLSNRTPARGDTRQPLRYRFASRLPRNRCSGYPTLPDGPRDESSFYLQNTGFACPFKRPSGEVGKETRRRSDAKESGSVAGQYQN